MYNKVNSLVLVFLIEVATMKSAVIEPSKNDVLVDNFLNPDKIQICRNNFCISNTVIESYYKGIFYTKDDISLHRVTISRKRKEQLTKFGIASFSSVVNTTSSNFIIGPEHLRPVEELLCWGDGDACCSTNVNFHLNVTMRNLTGHVRNLVHLEYLNPPKYQLIPHGTCGAYQSCQGVCFQETMYLTLLVYDENATSYPPLTFDLFEIPGYCSCKNVM